MYTNVFRATSIVQCKAIVACKVPRDSICYKSTTDSPHANFINNTFYKLIKLCSGRFSWSTTMTSEPMRWGVSHDPCDSQPFCEHTSELTARGVRAPLDSHKPKIFISVARVGSRGISSRPCVKLRFVAHQFGWLLQPRTASSLPYCMKCSRTKRITFRRDFTRDRTA